MKKILTLALVFSLSSALFADTLHVMKSSMKTPVIHTYKNMKRSTSLKNNTYYFGSGGNLVYTINGKTYITSLFEIELGDE